MTLPLNPAARARQVRNLTPENGLFAGTEWRVSPSPFGLEAALHEELQVMGRVLLQFNRAVNLLYRQSVLGKQPGWVSRWLDLGKPAELIALARDAAFKGDVPRVIRPDLVLTDQGVAITELDAVPGGIGLTAWANQTYHQLGCDVIGGAEGMLEGFAAIFGNAPRVRIVVSEESSMYRPEMEWLAQRLGPERFTVEAPEELQFADGEAVYRFYELFDLVNVPGAAAVFEAARQGRVRVTPPPKPIFEEKLLFALLWNGHLREFWRRELGEGFLRRLQKWVPYTWLVDPAPLPPHAVIPELGLTDWTQLKGYSQRQRELILKVSGFSDLAWGSRGVYLGSDISAVEWGAAVDQAVTGFETHPFVLQRYLKPSALEAHWLDPQRDEVATMQGRVRLSPYYFVAGDGDAVRPELGGVLATICPADKKIIHGMSEAILAPCAVIEPRI